jgi:leucyl-tRNA synthetase
MSTIASTTHNLDTYDPATLEHKWQEAWRAAEISSAPDPQPDRDNTYVFVTPPFTSGDAHMGHIRSYTIGDAYARFRRCCGDAVLFSLGFDAFGLPSEIAAHEHGMSPAEWVSHCRDRMCAQFGRLGISFDWERVFVSSDPTIYRWSQWLFLKLYEVGLIYQHDGQVEWCDSCRTVLANLQVEDGKCWRCETPVRFVSRTQWHLRRSAYNEENANNLTNLTSWSATAVAAQRAILGCTSGVEFDAYGLDGSVLTVFTTFPEAIGEGRFVLLSPNFPEIATWSSSPGVEDELALIRHGGGQRADRKEAGATVIDTGLRVQIATVPEPLPVLISPSVDARVGPTALLGIPSLDATDKAIADTYSEHPTLAWRAAKRQLSVRPATRYRAADFTISRQRAWGAPIPVVYCPDCGVVPVPLQDLPVQLPEDLDMTSEGNPLDRHEGFLACPCPQCGKPARRESDTLDCHIDAAWTELPLAVPPDDRSRGLFEHGDLQRWLPVSQLVHGADTGGFILNMRLVAKALRDADVLDCIPDGEPFTKALMHEMVQLNGRKMSKHLGNVIAPQELIEQFGADAVRFAILLAAAPARSFSWDDHALRYCARFLKELWIFAAPRLAANPRVLELSSIDTADRQRSRLEMWCAVACEKVTANLQALEMHQATRNIIRLFGRLEDFEQRVIARRGELATLDEDAVAAALMLLVRLLSPLAPHIAEELWQLGGGTGMIADARWPSPPANRSALPREHKPAATHTREV